MGGAQRYPSRRRVTMLACRHGRLSSQFTAGGGFFFERLWDVQQGDGFRKGSTDPTALLRLIKLVKMMDRPMSVADRKPVRRRDRGADPGFGVTHGAFHVVTLGEASRDRR
jgi:hypothetical protein